MALLTHVLFSYSMSLDLRGGCTAAQGHAHDRRGAGAQSQKKVVCARQIFFQALKTQHVY